MAIPLYTTGSLSPTFVPAPPVGVTVKLPSAFALFEWFPSILREPLSASDTLSGGAPSGIRTRDPLIKSQLLYQLSHRAKHNVVPSKPNTLNLSYLLSILPIPSG